LNILRRTMAYASSIRNNLDSLGWNFYILSNHFPGAIISTSASKYSKAANVIPLFTLYLNLSIWSLCDLCLFTAGLSLTFATTRLWSVSQSVHQFNLLLGHDRSEQWYNTSDLLVLYMTSYH
jgi:hypothetical protein